MNFYPPDEEIYKVLQASGILAENDVGTGVDLEGASIRRLELGVAIGASKDHLLGLDLVAYVEGPRLGVTQYRDVAGQGDHFGCVVGKFGEDDLGRADAGVYEHQQRAEPHASAYGAPDDDATSLHKVNE